METETKQEDVSASAPQASEKQAEQVTVEQLQAKYEGEIERLKKEAAGSTKASQKWQQRAERIDSLEGKLSKIEAMLSSFANVALPDDETRQTYEKRVKDAEPKLDPRDVGYGSALDVLLDDEGLTLDDIPKDELEAARELYQKGDFAAGAKAIKKSVKKVAKAKAETEAQSRKEAEDTDNAERQKKAAALKTPQVSSQGGQRVYDRTELRNYDPRGKSTKEINRDMEEYLNRLVPKK